MYPYGAEFSDQLIVDEDSRVNLGYLTTLLDGVTVGHDQLVEKLGSRGGWARTYRLDRASPGGTPRAREFLGVGGQPPEALWEPRIDDRQAGKGLGRVPGDTVEQLGPRSDPVSVAAHRLDRAALLRVDVLAGTRIRRVNPEKSVANDTWRP